MNINIQELQQLNQALQSQVPTVVGVADLGQAGYRIDYDGNETPEQMAAAEAIAASFTPTPEPDWPGFRAALYSDTSWMRVLNSNPAVASAIASTLWQATASPSLLVEVQLLWNAIATTLTPALSQVEIDGLNSITAGYSIPITLASDGSMTIG